MLGCLAGLCFLTTGAAADRVVLAPQGDTLPPDGLKAEFAISPRPGAGNLSWVQFSTHEGIEVEAQRLDLRTDDKPRFSLNVQYPLLSELDAVPAISIGVRDILGTGVERRSFYVAAGKSIPLSSRQLRLLHDFRWNIGLGTERLDGFFVGAQARVAKHINVYAEWFRNRPNLGVGVPFARDWQAKAYSLDGDLFYGLTYNWKH